ncbi:MAG: hypothetical protein ACE5NG_10150 [bacterium]
MSSIQDSIEIVGSEVIHKVNGLVSKKISVAQFVQALQNFADLELFPDILPEGVKYVARRGNSTVVVVEQTARPRAVFVIAENSPAAYGSKVKSVRRWLSFPYVELLILFYGNALSGYQQVFYRTRPLTSLDEELLLCNLPNVSTQGPQGLPYWFCSQYIGDVSTLSWPDKITKIINHLWKSGFNWSSDHHEGLSQFNAMKNLDKRITCFKRWEEETRKDPNFALKINWQQAGMTVRQAIEKLFKYATPKKEITNCKGLVDLLNRNQTKKTAIEKTIFNF